MWNDFDALNQYVARCQSFLQNSTPDNDVLLYYPIYDRFSSPGEEMIEHFDGVGKQFDNSAFKRGAEVMLNKGYAFDYVSDKQIANVVLDAGNLITEGKSCYRTIVIPRVEYIPVTTFQKIISLAEAGATIIALEGLPGSFAGYGHYEENKTNFESAMYKLENGKQVSVGVKEIKVGDGRVLEGDSLGVLLEYASVRRETFKNSGIQFIRKKGSDGRNMYLISNGSDKSFEGWLPIQSNAESVVLYDPMNGEFGKARIRSTNDHSMEVFVQLQIQQTIVLETYESDVETPSFKYYTLNATPHPLSGTWKISFESGGPKLPSSVETDSLSSWTAFGTQDYLEFSGTATYSITFKKPQLDADGWLIDLGVVKESAEVFINGKSLGTLIGPVYQLYVDGAVLKENNVLEVKVSNLMANRISDMDKKKIFWRKFYNANFPARKAENRKNGLFDASHWKPKDSGLLGPVQLIPVEISMP